MGREERGGRQISGEGSERGRGESRGWQVSVGVEGEAW